MNITLILHHIQNHSPIAVAVFAFLVFSLALTSSLTFILRPTPKAREYGEQSNPFRK